MSLPSVQAARGWSGLTVVDSDDQPLGKIIHIYLDRDTDLPEWAVVAMPGRRRRTFVPLAGAARKGNRIAVAVPTVAVSDAPAIRPGRELSDDDAARLYGHYVGASDDRKRGARRAPGRGLAARLKEVTAPPARSAAARLGTARNRLQEATRSDRGRRLLSLAGLGSALAAAAVAGRSRRPRTRRSPVAGNVKLAVGLAAGYVLGARAGRERYERLAELARRVAQRPEVRQLADRARSGLDAGVEQAAGAASDRLEQARTSSDR
jgi:PRC-barrel domain